MTNKTPNPDPSPFQRFQELAAKLLAVPKREIEEKGKRRRKKAKHGQRKTGSK